MSTSAIPLRLFHYNVAALHKTRLPVVSTVLLLHKGANSPQITGTLDVAGADGVAYLSFRYNVVRSAKSAEPICAVWQSDVDELLVGGLSTLPFAPISNVRPSAVARVIKEMRTRIEAEADSETEAAELWTATNVLMGLRYNKSFKTRMLQGVRRMRESITYKEILDDGRVEGELREARRILLQQGLRRLGVASLTVVARIDAISSLEAIEGLLDRIFDVETWDDLLSDMP